jgi:tRNA G18 (ribose-2'-O)-methylase SpoU
VIEITTLNDTRVSDYAHVGEPDWLRERGLFVAEGRLVVRRLFQTDTFTIRSVLITRTALAALEDGVDSGRCPIYVCDQDMMNRLAGFNFHRGCLALGERPPAIDVPNRFHTAQRLLALEGVGNPDNVGGLFRVAAAFGVDGILLDRTSGDPLYRKAIRTSMGAVFSVPFAMTNEWLETIIAIKTAGADAVALTPDRTSRVLSDYVEKLSPKQRVMLMLGAEGPGLSPDSLTAATTRVRIPIAQNVDSLNVVVAAGIALAAVSASLSSTIRSRDSRRR